jgi:iron complex outermembrane receptor protein
MANESTAGAAPANSIYSLARIVAIWLCIATPLAAAQTSSPATDPAADSADSLAEIVVTARKRDERLIDVPISITALDSSALESMGIQSIGDLAKATPGLTVDTTLGGSVRSDRSFNIYVMRGMVPSLTSNPTTTVFVNGAPFTSGQIGGLDDLARVEVLQGPQSAYFGRQTFAGAINFVTRDPGDTLGGSVSLLGGSRSYIDARGSVEGPLFSDKLTARLSLRDFSRDGSYDNQAVAQKSHDTLGDQSTKSATLQLLFKPTDNLKLSALGMYWEDDDGPGATAQYESTISNCRTAGGYRWFCGSLGAIPAGKPASNDIVDSWIRTIVTTANDAIRAAGVPSFTIPDEYGLKRQAYHWSFGVDYRFDSIGATLSSLTAVADDRYGTLIDLDNTDTSQVPRPVFYPAASQSFYNFPFYVGSHIQDQSQELRLVSDGDRQFRWLVGANYAWNRRDQAIGGLEFNLFFGTSSNSTHSRGVFFGLAYDVNDQWTVNLDGRHQRDHQSFPTSATGPRTGAAFSNFTPRLSVQYKISPDVMTYFTYSEGINPGTFNSVQLTAFEQQYIATNFAGVFNNSVIVTPEELKNYEVGLKGKFLDGRLTLTGALYHDIWSNQIVVSSFNVCRDAACTTPNLIANTSNNGKSKIQGVEFSVSYSPISDLTLSLAGAFNDSEIQSGSFGRAGQIRCGCTGPTLAQQAFNGSQLPNTAKMQLTAAIQYGGGIGPTGNWKWFARLDDSFKSKQFESQDNLASAPSLNFMNVRGGVSNENWRIEAFVENALNEDGVTNIATVTSLATPFAPLIPDAFFAGLPNLRTYGLRLNYRFGGSK